MNTNYKQYKKYKQKYKLSKKGGGEIERTSREIVKPYRDSIVFFFNLLERYPEIYDTFYLKLNLPKDFKELKRYLLSFEFTDLTILPEAVRFSNYIINKIIYDKNVEEIEIDSNSYIKSLFKDILSKQNFYLTGGSHIQSDTYNEKTICKIFISFLILIAMVFVVFYYGISIPDIQTIKKHITLKNLKDLNFLISTIIITNLIPICVKAYGKIRNKFTPKQEILPLKKTNLSKGTDTKDLEEVTNQLSQSKETKFRCMGIPGCEKNKNYDNCISDRECLWVNTQTGEATRIGGEKVPIILHKKGDDYFHYPMAKWYAIEQPPKTNTLIRRSAHTQPSQKKPLPIRAVRKTMKTIGRQMGVLKHRMQYVYPPK